MIASEIHPGRRARLCVTPTGAGYCYGTVEDFDGADVLMRMDSGSTLIVPWHEIVGTEEPVQDLDFVDRLAARLIEDRVGQ